MTMTDPGDLRQDSAADRSSAADAQGSSSLSPSEQAKLDQMDAGLKDSKPAGSGHGMAKDAPQSKVGKANSTGTTSGDKPGGSTSGVAGGAAGGAGGAGAAIKAAKSAAQQYSSNHRGPLMAGGAVGLILAIIVAGFVALLPLKLESMMENIFEKRIGGRIEYYMEKRAESMMEKYIESSVGRTDPEFEKSIVATGQPIRDLYRTFRVRKFEAQLEDHQGVRFQRNPDGTIDLYQDGDLVGNLSKADAINVFNDSIRSETEWYQFYKRMHLRTWMKEAYGITKWDFYTNVVNKIKCSLFSCTDDDAAAKEIKTEQVQDASVPAETADALDLGCATSTGEADCIDDPNDPAQPGLAGDGLSDAVPEGDGNTEEPTLDTAAENAEQQAVAQTDKDIAEEGSTITNRILSAILPKFIADAVTQVLEKLAGPLIIISVVDMASHIDHFLWNGGADKAIVGAHEVEYAAQFAQWMTMASQWKSGQNISGDEFNATMQELNGTENAASFRQIYGTGTGGQGLDTTGVGTNTQDNSMARSIDENAHPIEDFYRVIASQPLPPALVPMHEMLNLWYDSIGKIWGWINNVITKVLGWTIDLLKLFIKTFDPPLYDIINMLMSMAGQLLTKLIGLLIIPAVDGTEVGADLINGLDAGAVVTGIGFARDLGAPLINPIAAQNLDSEIARSQARQDDQLSIATRLFSPNFTHSMVNNLAFAMPATPGGALDDSTSYAATILANPLHLFASIPSMLGIITPADAAANDPDSPQNLYGMNDYGYTDAQLNANDTAALNQAWANAQTRLGHVPTYGDLEETDCPNVPNPQVDPNICRLDIATIQSLGGRYASTNSADGGLGD